MTLTVIERMATGWFLSIAQNERKRISVSEVRCRKGCLLASVVTIDRALWVLGVTDSTKTEMHPTAVLDALDAQDRPPRLTLDAVQGMTVDEFLMGFRAKPRAFSMVDLAAVDIGHRHGFLDPWQPVKDGDKHVRGRCRHLDGYIPAEAFNLDKKSVRVSQLDRITDLG